MYLSYFAVECLQPSYSLLERSVEAHELPLCLEKRIGVIAYSPLYRGLLTGKYASDHAFDDHRANDPLFKGKAFRRILDALEQIQPIADGYGLTLPQLAIRWVLTHPALSCAIVGVKKPDHIETIVPAAEGKLPPADWHKLAETMAMAKRQAKQLA